MDGGIVAAVREEQRVPPRGDASGQSAAGRLARVHAEIRGVHARRARVEEEYRAGRLSHDEYTALGEELRGCLYGLGLALYDDSAQSARA